MVTSLKKIAEVCETLVAAMDFSFLYQARKKVMSVGYDLREQRLEASSYDLLASEARIAVFVAIAKGDVPQEAWFHLGRGHTLFRGEAVLMSWTGTMFEYLMPTLWMRHYSDTITEQSNKAVVRVQREYARRKGVPWGISESACRRRRRLRSRLCRLRCSRPGDEERRRRVPCYFAVFDVTRPRESIPHEAIQNLRRMEEFGWSGRYGFYEAVDYSRSGGEVIRTWMAHHQGMALLAACNLLFNSPIQQYFHSEPQVMATELLLHERVPSSVVVEAEEGPLVPQAAAAAPAG